MLAQQIDKEGTGVLVFETSGRKAGAEYPEPIRRILQDLGEGSEADLVRGAFTSLMELLADLQCVESVDAAKNAVEDSVAAFSSVQDKALNLVARIETEVLLLEDVARGPGSALLDVSFALRHELRRAFDLDIAHIEGERPFESAEGRVAHAHGVLRNCFRQSVVLLAQAFNPSLTERDVFADAASRQKESIMLCEALSSLLSSIEEATKRSFPQSAVSVIENLDVFRHDSMPYLMRRDWEMFDAFENKIVSAKDEHEFAGSVKTLLVGLETLLGQVRMRATLSEEPATAEPAGKAESARKAARSGFTFSFLKGRPALWSAVAASVVFAVAVTFFADFTLRTQGRDRVAAASVESAPRETASHKTEQAVAQPAEAQPAEVQPNEVAPPKAVEEVPASKPEMEIELPHNQAGGLTLQVGAFRDSASALESTARLKAIGVEARVQEATKGGQVIYRVQVGNFNSSLDASQFGKQLLAKGIARSFIVTKVG